MSSSAYCFPHDCKIGHFTSWKERDRLPNVRNEKRTYEAWKTTVCQSANLWYCCRRHRCYCLSYLFSVEERTLILFLVTSSEFHAFDSIISVYILPRLMSCFHKYIIISKGNAYSLKWLWSLSYYLSKVCNGWIFHNGAHFSRDSLILSTLVFPLEHLTVQKS